MLVVIEEMGFRVIQWSQNKVFLLVVIEEMGFGVINQWSQNKVFACQLFADDTCSIINCERGSIANLMQVYEDFCQISSSKIAP